MANSYDQPIGTIVRVTKSGRKYSALTPDNTVVTGIETYALRHAYKAGTALELTEIANKKLQWRQVPMSNWSALNPTGNFTMNVLPLPENNEEFVAFLRNAAALKPSNLKMSELKWRHIIRTAMRGDNLMFLGPSGCGKTMSAYAVASVLKRPLHYFNMGATQDPRSTLIGNTHFSPTSGTYVAESAFVQAIQQENAIILLDEISRAHPDASNILMTVLDKMQRYLRLDEKPGSPVVHVNKTVSFFLTANVGSEYTGTRTMDRALIDRCKLVEVEPLDLNDEVDLLSESFPNVRDIFIRAIAEIAVETRKEVVSESPKVDTIISTRVTKEMAEMLFDGFTLEEAAQICIYPYFSDAGGAESQRSFMKKLVQKHIPVIKPKTAGASGSTTTSNTTDLPW